MIRTDIMIFKKDFSMKGINTTFWENELTRPPSPPQPH